MIKKIKRNKDLLNTEPGKLSEKEKIVINLMTYNQNVDEILIKSK